MTDARRVALETALHRAFTGEPDDELELLGASLATPDGWAIAIDAALAARRSATSSLEAEGAAPVEALEARIRAALLTLSRARDAALDATSRRASLQYSRLIECVSDAVIASDLDFRVTEWNPGAERLFGYSREEAIGCFVGEITQLEYEGVTREEVLVRFARDGAWRGQVKQKTKDGRAIWTEASVGLVRTVDGHPLGAVAVNRDVTQEREQERRLREKRRQLERTNRELEQFAYILSHDLQEPARTVATYVRLLEPRVRDRLDDEDVRHFGFVAEGAERMRALVAALHAFTRIGLPMAPLPEVELGRVVDGALADHRLRVVERSAVVEIGPLPTVRADASLLGQVLSNLVGNALKFGPPGVRLRIHGEEEDAHWIVHVVDDGLGIDADDHARIFDMFQRLHTREEHPGTGVGLAVVKKIVESHGGRVGVHSSLGAGADFWFTLPIP